MKVCPKCSTPLEDSAKFCTTCGVSFAPPPAAEPEKEKTQSNPFAQQFNTQQPPCSAPPEADPFDHTKEFHPNDISDNKVIAMLIYLMGFAGVLIALLSQNHSAYVAFHLRQALKFMVCNSLIVLVMAVLSWTVIVPIICAIAMLVLIVVKIICFVDICKGKAIEPYIIRNLDFLK